MSDQYSEYLPYKLSDLPQWDQQETAGELGSPNERAATRIRRAALRGRDEPELHEMNLGALASVAAGFLPYSGIVDALGWMPDFEGGYEPSLLENVRQKNHLTSGAQLIGAATGFALPAKIARATTGARRLASRNRVFDPSIRRAEGEMPQFDLERKVPTIPPDAVNRLFATPGLEERMLGEIARGRKLGVNWYNTEPLRREFVKELGAEAGDRAFREYMRYVAATSAASDVNANVRNGTHYFNMARREGRVPNVDDILPRPYNHWNKHNHQIFANKVLNGALDPITYQKLNSFFENLTGNYAPVTVDRHALRLPAILAEDPNFLAPKYKQLFDNTPAAERPSLMKRLVETPSAWRAPTAGEYATTEQYIKALAKKAGLSPAEAQAALWVSGADRTGVRDYGLMSFMEHFEDRLHITADKYKIPAKEVLERFIRGEMELVSLDQSQNAVV